MTSKREILAADSYRAGNRNPPARDPYPFQRPSTTILDRRFISPYRSSSNASFPEIIFHAIESNGKPHYHSQENEETGRIGRGMNLILVTREADGDRNPRLFDDRNKEMGITNDKVFSELLPSIRRGFLEVESIKVHISQFLQGTEMRSTRNGSYAFTFAIRLKLANTFTVQCLQPFLRDLDNARLGLKKSAGFCANRRLVESLRGTMESLLGWIFDAGELDSQISLPSSLLPALFSLDDLSDGKFDLEVEAPFQSRLAMDLVELKDVKIPSGKDFHRRYAESRSSQNPGQLQLFDYDFVSNTQQEALYRDIKFARPETIILIQTAARVQLRHHDAAS